MTQSAQMENAIKQIVSEQLEALGRPDLFRAPLVSFSSADDARYSGLKEIIGEWHQNPSELLPGARSVISYFVPFTRDVAFGPKQEQGASLLWSEAYLTINQHFLAINKALTDYLTGQGYAAKDIKPTHTYDPKDLKCMWSHRSAAAIAGLGTFGANGLLITPKGSGGRFCSVITTAQLKADQSSLPDACLYRQNGACGLCFAACPAGALSPDAQTDKFACQDELNRNGQRMREKTGQQTADTCGMCISVCPLAYIE